MKPSASMAALAITLATALLSTSAAVALEAYKTKSDQLVVTGLQPKMKYDVQYKNTLGKNGKRKVNTNACGEALIDKVGKFQTVMINGQSIAPQTLALQEHRRCSVRNPSVKRRTPTKIKAQPSAVTSPTATPTPSAIPSAK